MISKGNSIMQGTVSGRFTYTISEEGILKSNENIVKFRTTKMNIL